MTGGTRGREAGPDEAEEAARRLLAWIEERDWTGHDPFDLLLSPLAAPLRRLRLPAIAWIQMGRRLPVDLRGLLGVPPHLNPKALAMGIHGLIGLGDESARLGDLVDRLQGLAAPGGGWGYPFAWANRHFLAPAGTPSSVVTAFVGHALLDAREAGVDTTLDRVLAGADFIVTRLNRVPTSGGGFLFSYTPVDDRGVHNASVLAASLLARCSALEGGDPGWAALAMEAATATLRSQDGAGRWPYGVSRRDAFVDSFHTGYVLSALRTTFASLAHEEPTGVMEAGLDAWRRDFLTGPAVGAAPGVPWPCDLHAVAQAILTGIEFCDLWPEGPDEGRRLAAWALDNARRSDGAFHYLHRPGRPNRIAYLRWTQSWMFRALAALSRPDPSR